MILLGAGVWGLATASVAKALVGTLAMLSISPVARLTPSFLWRLSHDPSWGFGGQSSKAAQLAATASSQLLTVGVAVVGGLAVAGLWSLASRLLQVPFLLFGALWQVSYPAAAQPFVGGRVRAQDD